MKTLSFDRPNIKAGIAHIGVGNFHRAHQAFYTHQILSDITQQNWGICGISLLEGDRAFAKAFEKQHYEYTLTSFAANGESKTQLIESIVDHYFAPDNPKAVLDILSSENIKIVSLTITEGGYNLDENDQFNLQDKEIVHDLNNSENPVTVFGYLFESLKRRFEKGTKPFTVMSCDNLQHNGVKAKKALLAFAEARDPAIASRIKEEVAFPNAMVDRITPAVGKEEKERLNKLNDTHDEVPVFCEDFHQWVIEDQFCAGRPYWEKAGAIFTNDVAAYEKIKLKLLNGSHTAMSFPAFLAGFRQVHEAIDHPVINQFIKQCLDEDAGPLCQPVAGIEIDTYKKNVIERFSNQAVKDQVGRLCFDGMSKLAVYIVDTIQELLTQNKPHMRMAFLLAVYAQYLNGNEDDQGNSYQVREPQINEKDWTLIKSGEVTDFLRVSIFQKLKLDEYPQFTNSYVNLRSEIASKGIIATMQYITNKNLVE